MVPQSAPLSEYLGALVAGEGWELVGSVGLVLPPVQAHPPSNILVWRQPHNIHTEFGTGGTFKIYI